MLSAGIGWAAALAAAGVVSAVAWRAGALTKTGALAATAVGALVFRAGGLAWAVLLLVFFVSGSVLTGWRRRCREGASGPRGAGRDARQVLANGGVAALAAALRVVVGPHGADSAAVAAVAGGWVYDALVAGSLAAMMADTWATELGLLSGRRPVLLVGLRPVEPGRSGGVTGPGTLAGMIGAAVLAALSRVALGSAEAAAGALVGGVVGMLADSMLGATLQGRWRCVRCGQAVEGPRRHMLRCAGPLRLEGGHPWLDNDAVNALACAVGALTSLITVALVRRG